MSEAGGDNKLSRAEVIRSAVVFGLGVTVGIVGDEVLSSKGPERVITGKDVETNGGHVVSLRLLGKDELVIADNPVFREDGGISETISMASEILSAYVEKIESGTLTPEMKSKFIQTGKIFEAIISEILNPTTTPHDKTNESEINS